MPLFLSYISIKAKTSELLHYLIFQTMTFCELLCKRCFIISHSLAELFFRNIHIVHLEWWIAYHKVELAKALSVIAFMVRCNESVVIFAN